VTPDEMIAEANRLTELQRRERGSEPVAGLDGKPSSRPGPYVPTAEGEAQAAEILRLRKTAARVKWPTTPSGWVA
jgi:hypothetical protein